MITLSTFQKQLSVAEPTPLSLDQSVDGQEQYLLKLLAALYTQTEELQAQHLEKVLTILSIANIDEPQRLKLMATVIDTANQLIATLRQSYIYETGMLSESQLSSMAKVKSLYYQIIIVYDGVARRNNSLLDPDNSQKPLTNKGWKRYFNAEKSASIMLMIAIYQMLSMYQKLLGEEAICYRQPPAYWWSKINALYHLAHQHHGANIDLSVYITTKRANDIHQLYVQICLHSLLNLRAMRRPNILLVQRLLPEWAKHMVATIEPNKKARVFVDLTSDHPPRYLTATSVINPYEECYVCVFIELAPMVEYLHARMQALIEEGREGVEYWLLNKISMTISYRYLQPQLTLPTKYSAKKAAVLITGFNNIHYRASDSSSFTSLMAIKELPDEQRPRYDTVSKKSDRNSVLNIEIFDNNNELSLFRTLHLLPKISNLATGKNARTTRQANVAGLKVNNTATLIQTIINKNKGNGACSDTKKSTVSLASDGFTGTVFNDGALTGTVLTESNSAATAPPPLYIMSLCLVCRSEDMISPDWSLGVVRWLNLDAGENPEVEWQVLGHDLMACGLRLEGRDTRSCHFVPAFILGQDDQLQTLSTVIVPTSYFETNDKVIMRINTKQTSLRLGRRVLVTDEFSQYEVVQL